MKAISIKNNETMHEHKHKRKHEHEHENENDDKYIYKKKLTFD